VGDGADSRIWFLGFPLPSFIFLERALLVFFSDWFLTQFSSQFFFPFSRRSTDYQVSVFVLRFGGGAGHGQMLSLPDDSLSYDFPLLRSGYRSCSSPTKKVQDSNFYVPHHATQTGVSLSFFAPHSQGGQIFFFHVPDFAERIFYGSPPDVFG